MSFQFSQIIFANIIHAQAILSWLHFLFACSFLCVFVHAPHFLHFDTPLLFCFWMRGPLEFHQLIWQHVHCTWLMWHFWWTCQLHCLLTSKISKLSPLHEVLSQNGIGHSYAWCLLLLHCFWSFVLLPCCQQMWVSVVPLQFSCVPKIVLQMKLPSPVLTLLHIQIHLNSRPPAWLAMSPCDISGTTCRTKILMCGGHTHVEKQF